MIQGMIWRTRQIIARRHDQPDYHLPSDKHVGNQQKMGHIGTQNTDMSEEIYLDG